MRQRARMAPFSTRAKTMFVLPTSMARSMAFLADAHVGGVNGTDAAVFQAKPKRSVGIDAIEAAADLTGVAFVYVELGSDGVSASEPGAGKILGVSRPPEPQDSRHAQGEQRS